MVAYNKIDVPDSGDYWDLVQEYLVQEEGLPPDHVFAISAATGRGVTELVRGVRGLLEELGPAEVALETDALNRTKLPKRYESDVSTTEMYWLPTGGGVIVYSICLPHRWVQLQIA